MHFLLNILIFLNLAMSCASTSAKEKKVLVFHKAVGYWHESIPAGVQAIEDLGEEHQFEVTETNNAEIFEQENLEQFELIIFLNTTGDVLDQKQQKAFEQYIAAGGNFFGIHSAADTEYNWKWYGRLVGAYFNGHPEVQSAKINVEAPEHPMAAHLPLTWERTDEWYNFKEIQPDIEVILSLDESSYQGGANEEFHPIAWYRKLDEGGISIYTGLGHTIASYVEPAFVAHILQGILLALEAKEQE